MKKYVFLYGGIIALSFFWTGSAFISMTYHLMEFFSYPKIDVYQSVLGYLFQVLGMVLFALGTYYYPIIFMKKEFFTITMIAEAAAITIGILSKLPFVSLFFSFSINLLHGVVAGYYLLQLSAFVPQQYRGRVFGFGYALGSIGSWLLSLPFGGAFLKMDSIIIVYLFLIAITIVLNSRRADTYNIEEDESLKSSFEPKLLAHMLMVLILLSLVKNIGFYFPVSDISVIISVELLRGFYSLGLIAAGIINDKNRRYGAICCVASLVFSFVSFALEGKGFYAAPIWITGYIFFGFFSVYRVLVFSDIAAKSATLLPLAACGLMAGRVGDAFGTLIGILLSGKTVLILVVTSSLFIIVIFMFFSLYQKLYNATPLERESEERTHEAFVNEYTLTIRESEVLSLVVQGYSNLEISGALYVSESTVKFHVGNILKKTRCSNRTDLTMLFKNKHVYS